MKEKIQVWLPPRGDHRLLRFQERLWQETKIDAFAAIQPVLIRFDGAPIGEFDALSVGSWTLGPYGLYLQGVTSTNQPLGFWMAVETDPAWSEEAFAAFPVPIDLRWTKGRTASLEFEAEGDVFTYSFSRVSVAKARVSKA